MKERRAVVGFYRDKGKTKPITKSVANLNRRKVIQKAARFQGIKPKFFRAVPLPKARCSSAGGLLKPQLTDVEKVKNGHVVAWWPLQNEPPIYKRSFEKVLCFAKTPGGAIIGSVTGEGGFKGGERCVLGTAEQPDVDLSDEMHGDFAALGEVRYHRPVPTKVFGTFKVDAKLLKRIGKAYSPPRWEWTGYDDKGKPTYEKYEGEGFPDEDKIKRLRDEINREMEFK